MVHDGTVYGIHITSYNQMLNAHSFPAIISKRLIGMFWRENKSKSFMEVASKWWIHSTLTPGLPPTHVP